jgi:predicted anti-sigma-YlaC factor YlaD
MDVDLIKRVVCEIITTHLDEISCEECFKHVGRFAELTLSGQDASTTMPLIHEHLELCADCRAEFEALLSALGATPSVGHVSHHR